MINKVVFFGGFAIIKESLAVLAGQGFRTLHHYPLFAYFSHTQDSQQSIMLYRMFSGYFFSFLRDNRLY